MSTEPWLVVGALVLMALAVPGLRYAWSEEPPEPELDLGWWLPGTGLATPAAVETRVREQSVLVQLRAYLSARREADEVACVATRRYAVGIDPGPISDVACLASYDGRVVRVEVFETIQHELDADVMAVREEAVRRFAEGMHLPQEMIDPDHRTPEEQRRDRIREWIEARS